jgi:hypothetical protein
LRRFIELKAKELDSAKEKRYKESVPYHDFTSVAHYHHSIVSRLVAAGHDKEDMTELQYKFKEVESDKPLTAASAYLIVGQNKADR